MTTRLEFSFPFGRYHGTAWGRHPNEGITDFPPSLWRILRALYASWKQYSPHLTEAEVHPVLKTLAVHPRYRVPAYRLAHTRHYLPGVGHQPPIKNDTGLGFDNFAVLDKSPTTGESTVTVEWGGDLDSDQLSVLAQLAKGVRYLGRAESVCDVEASIGHEPLTHHGLNSGERLFQPVTTGKVETEVLCPVEGLNFDSLTATPTWVRGKAKRLLPANTSFVGYSATVPKPQRAAEIDRLTFSGIYAVRWSIKSPRNPNLSNALIMAEMTRRAANYKYEQLAKKWGLDITSETLSGKGPDGSRLDNGHQHAHFLVFGNDLTNKPDRPTETVVAYAPAGFTMADLEALVQVSRPAQSSWDKTINPKTRLIREAMGELASVAPELCGTSHRWTSYTPFVPARYRKRESEIEYLTANIRLEAEGRLSREHKNPWLADHASSVRVAGKPERQGLRYRTHRAAGRTSRAKAPSSFGLTLEFDEPVTGLVSLGRHAHLGLGLFLPDK